MTDRTVYLAVTPAMRRVLAAMAENLLEMLDQIDGDPDLEEPGDLEPSLGWGERGPSVLTAYEAHDDREQEIEHDEDNGDREPEETDCDLAGAETDLEHADGDYDGPLLIWGGNEDAPEVRP
jgi:hypothetical protein